MMVYGKHNTIFTQIQDDSITIFTTAGKYGTLAFYKSS